MENIIKLVIDQIIVDLETCDHTAIYDLLECLREESLLEFLSHDTLCLI